jgi:DNA-binding MarR family transcriptional regulator
MSSQPDAKQATEPQVSRLGDALATLYYVARRDYGVDLSHRAIRVLQFVAFRATPPRVDEIARFLGCAASTASELIKRLQKKELLVRRRSESDERVVEIELSEAGRTALTEHTSLDPALLDSGLLALADEERETLIQLLGKMTEAVRREGDN